MKKTIYSSDFELLLFYLVVYLIIWGSGSAIPGGIQNILQALLLRDYFGWSLGVHMHCQSIESINQIWVSKANVLPLGLSVSRALNAPSQGFPSLKTHFCEKGIGDQ